MNVYHYYKLLCIVDNLLKSNDRKMSIVSWHVINNLWCFLQKAFKDNTGHVLEGQRDT
jgi:hypothetical protein